MALFDPDDLPLVKGHLWRAVGVGARRYAATGSGGETYMHRVVVGAAAGEADHRDHDRLNNRKANLRLCSHADNLCNLRLPKSSTTGFKGVTRRGRLFRAQIRFRGKSHYAGSYETAEEAARAYDRLARTLHGEFAATNAGLGLIPEIPNERS